MRDLSIDKQGVSIVTIVLNQRSEIAQTIKSVIEQKSINYEYIIIDGGSTDGTLEIIASYKKYISHIISEPDGGIYYAINKGIKLAKFPLIGLIHCGDRYKPDSLKLIVETFYRTSADIVYGDMEITENVGNQKLSYEYKADHKLLQKRMSIFHPSTFVKSSVYKKLGIYNTSYRLAADYEFFLHAFKENCSFFHVPQVIAVFCAGGLSGRSFRVSLIENFKIRLQYQGILKAIVFVIITSAPHFLYVTRNTILRVIIGRNNFEKLKIFIKNEQSS